MKKLLLLISIFSFSANALVFEVIQPCQFAFAIKEQIEILNAESVSKISHTILKNEKLPYIADEANMLSILNTPYSNDAFEVVSKDHYRSYGWCYDVDKISPDVTMDKFIFDPKVHNKITWYYGYAELIDGVWVNYCEPLYLHKHNFICDKL